MKSCDSHMTVVCLLTGCLPCECAGSVSLLEQLLKVISRELTVGEVFQIMQGKVDSLERIQLDLRDFIRDKLLGGAETTKERKKEAVSLFLQHLKPSLEEIKVC